MVQPMLRLALIQMLVGPDKASNVKRATDLVRQAVTQHKAELVCLPECFNSPYGNKYFAEYAETVPGGPTFLAMQEAAKENNVYLVAGSIPEIGSNGKLYNCSFVFNPKGEYIGSYRKMHLFDINLPTQSYRESSTLAEGSDFLTFEVPVVHDDKFEKVFRVGLGICYDVRFPELALIYSQYYGCHLLLYPAAFTPKTGTAHWELYARARALDTQCYVGMCSPASDLTADFVCFGDSIITSPWGEVLAKADKMEEIVIHPLDLHGLIRVRDSVPISRQRRLDMYSLPKPVRDCHQHAALAPRR